MTGDIDDFIFYLTLTKPIIVNLTSPKDRTTASAWIKKLQELNNLEVDKGTCLDYLKLLLFALQRDKLGGIFEKIPPLGPLRPLVEKTTGELLDLVKVSENEKPIIPKVYTAVGGDFCDYVAVQEIPKFGLHGYYAFSTEPLSRWIQPSSYSGKVLLKYLPCFKDTCKSAKIGHQAENENQTGVSTCFNASSHLKEKSHKRGGTMEESKEDEEGFKMPAKIQQARRKELPEVGARPCWGTSRYIDRLIDQSPHYVADLHLSGADAMLHRYKDRKMKLSRRNSVSGNCTLSSRRRQVERMLDLPPCVYDPGENVEFEDENELYSYLLEVPCNRRNSYKNTSSRKNNSSNSNSKPSNNSTIQHYDEMNNETEPEFRQERRNAVIDIGGDILVTDDTADYSYKNSTLKQNSGNGREKLPTEPFPLQDFIQPDELMPGVTEQIDPANVHVHQEIGERTLNRSNVVYPEYTRWSMQAEASENLGRFSETEFQDIDDAYEPSISVIRRRNVMQRETEEPSNSVAYSSSVFWEDAIDRGRDQPMQHRTNRRARRSSQPQESLQFVSLASVHNDRDLDTDFEDTPESYHEVRPEKSTRRNYGAEKSFRRSRVMPGPSNYHNHRKRASNEDTIDSLDEQFFPIAHSSFIDN